MGAFEPIGIRAAGPLRAIGVVLLLAMMVGTFGAQRNTSTPWPVWFGVVLSGLATVPVLVSMPAPTALIGSGAVTALYFAAGYADGPVFLAIPAVAFVVALTSTRRSWDWTGVAVAAGVAGLVSRGPLHHADGHMLWQCIGLAALAVAAWAIAASVNARRLALTERNHSLAAEERIRMAMELHDGVGHGLALIAMQAGAALYVFDRDPAAARASLTAIRDTSRESLEQLRSELDRFAGSERAPRRPSPGLADLDELVARVRSGGLDVRLELAPGPAVPLPVEHAAYAVVQESLTNVLRHAAASYADVSVQRDGNDLVVVVKDDGRVAVNSEIRSGHGISGMRSRVAVLGGRLAADRHTAGFEVRAVIPVGE
ncbi:sensor histidine kinase [Rudaeicoccus suwonensis]|uniref:histidine kinase n=1 Tax=Rudaeicoccus suwonensis TaxID=657409 RepID=A0A561E6W4_9MICO|nr:histidine kinase [Rudaeicoccus suwonensis]TWE11358.1 signal transduction histidine kinase [Rudaeicoccus suwonensis]